MRPILVVVDDDREGEAIERLLGPYRPVARFSDTRLAGSRALSQPPIGLIVDSGSGKQSEARDYSLAIDVAESGCPIGALGSDARLALPYEAIELKRPVSRSGLSAFVHAVFAFDYGLPKQVANSARAKAVEWRLTLKQVDILLAHIAGAPRDAYTAKRGVARSTYRVHVTELLAKAAVGSRMDHVVMEILRSAAVQ